jgi:uncharacterized protein (DUF2141 family)
MKNRTTTSFIFLLLASLLLPNTLQAGQGKLTVRNIVDDRGIIMVAVTPEAATSDFPGKKNASLLLQIPARPGDVSQVFELPTGRYAIAVFHDIDGDGELWTGLFGIPLEPVGFSNDPSWFFGPASFAESAFNVTDANFEVTVTLNSVNE